MKITYKKISEFKILGFKLFEWKSDYVEFQREQDKPFDTIFIEKAVRYIESNN